MTDKDIYRDIKSIESKHPNDYTIAMGLYTSAQKYRADKKCATMALAEATALQASLKMPERKMVQRPTKMRFIH